MSNLLATKLHRPAPLPKRVHRPQLIQRLNDGLESGRQVTLVSAPAGFGKTTLLSEWVNALDLPAAWLSLDESDNDPIRFWNYLVAACQSVHGGVGEAARALFHSPQPLPDDTIPTILINDLAGLKGNLILILDDYHVIQNQSIHAAFSFLLDHLPDQLHLVLSTRVDPPWPLARLRARNQLIELRAADLRFTPDEAAAFLNQMMDLNLSVEDVAALEARTEGWIAGLQLAVLSMQGRSDLAGFVKAFTGSHVYIAEYLIEEVLQHQPEDVQTFLLKTSILDRLNAAVCEAVTDCQDGQTILKQLHKANIFLTPLDDEDCWFRYHRLFADLLQARLRQTFSSEAIAVLHTRASRWYEHHGLVVDAVNHALAARDFDEAARLIEMNTYPMMTRGELTTLLWWIEALPDEVTQRRPMCTLAKAWVLTFAGVVQQIEPLLRRAEGRITSDDETLIAREVRGNAAAMRAFIAIMAGDNERALELAQRAEALLPESSVSDGSVAPFDFGARSIIPFALGTAYRGRGQYNKAAEAFEREVQMGEDADDTFIWVNAVVEVVNTRRVQGELREASEICRRAQHRVAERGMHPFGSIAKLDTALSEVLCEQNELDEARQRVTGAIARMPAWNMPVDQLFAHLTLMHIQESQSDFAGAFETLRAAHNLQATYPTATRSMNRRAALDEIRLYLASGDVATASHLMTDFQPGASRLVYLHDQELILLARLRLAQGKPAEAATILAPLADEAETGKRKSALLDILALQACVLDAQGDRAAALTVLMKALTLAEPEGFVRIFADEGEAMRILLAAAAHQLALATDQASIPLRAYAVKLLDAFHRNSSAVVTPLSSDKVTGLIEPLTARELEILRLIAAGDSNRTIAEKLVITVSAVKKHTGNIFGKLNVNSRTQAIVCARQLGLLSTDG